MQFDTDAWMALIARYGLEFLSLIRPTCIFASRLYSDTDKLWSRFGISRDINWPDLKWRPWTFQRRYHLEQYIKRYRWKIGQIRFVGIYRGNIYCWHKKKVVIAGNIVNRIDEQSLAKSLRDEAKCHIYYM